MFDNSDGSAPGEFVRFNEISVRRRVSREGQSEYFLNGSKCRRRDITDLFLGTGLGPRSYAIIEQGMISRLIEAKPEELRVYIEEAAGISKYKERRKETESRIRRTQENLERLTDLRDELGRQLQHLERQAQSAEKYKAYKQEERQKKAELTVLRWQSLDTDLQTWRTRIRDTELELEKQLSERVSLETALESCGMAIRNVTNISIGRRRVTTKPVPILPALSRALSTNESAAARRPRNWTRPWPISANWLGNWNRMKRNWRASRKNWICWSPNRRRWS